MSDLIDRKTAIDALGKEGLITAMVIVDRLPSVQPQRWIPVSQALPEISKFVIVTDSNGLIEIACRMHEGRKIIWWVRDYSGTIQVTAWMPLPKPLNN